MSTKQYFIVVLVVVFSVLGAFYSGFFLKDLVIKTDSLSIPENKSLIPYFNDEIVLISKEKPNITLVANASRFYNSGGSYTHRQKIFFFDGIKWSSEFSTTNSNDLKIASTNTIPSWTVTDDPSRVLKQKIKGTVKTEKYMVEFSVPVITNELGIRSLEDYTVFRSEADGEIVIDNKRYESYVLYTRTYSYNSSVGLVNLSKEPIGVNTDWLAFWDENGNFYNIDETIVDRMESDPYKSHSIAVIKDANGNVQKSFELDIKVKSNIGYNINVKDNVSRLITVNFINSIKRNPTNKFVDNKIGQVVGEVKLENGETIKGIGLYEYIYQ